MCLYNSIFYVRNLVLLYIYIFDTYLLIDWLVLWLFNDDVWDSETGRWHEYGFGICWSWVGYWPTFFLKMWKRKQMSDRYIRRDIWDMKRVRQNALQEHFRYTDLLDISCWQFGSSKESNLTHLMTSLKTEGIYFKTGTTVLWTWNIFNTVRYSRNKIGKCRVDISRRR
jgi:hypothetical protein